MDRSQWRNMTGDQIIDAWARLQSWYIAQCDGEWEHSYGVTIETLDNPGWSLSVDLSGTRLDGCKCPRTDEGLDDEDFDDEGETKGPWLEYYVKNNVFEAACDPSSLSCAVRAFLSWAESEVP